jgi:hypothetical protein
MNSALAEFNAWQTLVIIPMLCIVAMLAGTYLRIRSYIYLSIGFLATDLIFNMIHYGLEYPILGALFLTLLGLSIVGGMIVFSLERQRILNKYSAIFQEVKTWK